ncbi:hypothetical protein [Tsukamurella tyrosinosolvens]|uniref:hypothetical protein n=1 Tax=Tsukamurella tyrosinosolvens TaxID=57704 RepID=UPI0034636666
MIDNSAAIAAGADRNFSFTHTFIVREGDRRFKSLVSDRWANMDNDGKLYRVLEWAICKDEAGYYMRVLGVEIEFTPDSWMEPGLHGRTLGASVPSRRVPNPSYVVGGLGWVSPAAGLRMEVKR